jgi:hypothetical protein
LDRSQEPTSHGVPLSVAYDSDSDPYNTESSTLLEPFFYTDHAEQVVRMAQAKAESEFGEHANDHRVWGVKQVPRPARAVGGG